MNEQAKWLRLVDAEKDDGAGSFTTHHRPGQAERLISDYNGNQNDQGWFQALAGYGIDPERPGKIVAGIYRLRRGMRHPLHLHEAAAELYYVLSGSARFTVGMESRNLERGDGLYIPQDVPHAIDAEEDDVEVLYVFNTEENEPLQTVWLAE